MTQKLLEITLMDRNVYVKNGSVKIMIFRHSFLGFTILYFWVETFHAVALY